MSHTGLRGLFMGVPAIVLAVLITGCVTGCVTGCATARGGAVGSPPPVAEPRDARELWPGAAVTLPPNEGDSRFYYGPWAVLDPSHVLISAWEPDPGRAVIMSMDTRTSATKEIAALPSTEGPRGYGVNHAWPGTRHIVVSASAKDPDSVGGELFAITDGKVTRISGLPDVWVGLQVVDDFLIWSDAKGVWRLPLPAGGVPEQVPGGSGLDLVEWPWVTDGGFDLDGPAFVSATEIEAWLSETPKSLASALREPAPWQAGEPSEPVAAPQTKLVNLETGEVRPVVAASGVGELRCGPQWCRGVDTVTKNAVVQRPDGSGVLRLDWRSTEPMPGAGEYPGRFQTFALPLSPAVSPTPSMRGHRSRPMPSDMVVVDLETGAVARLFGSDLPCALSGGVGLSGGMVRWGDEAGADYALNLKAV